jgi:hypothetical protein
VSKQDAMVIAYIPGGKPLLREDASLGRDQWLVVFQRGDGGFVALSESCVDEHYDRDAFHDGQCYATISFISCPPRRHAAPGASSTSAVRRRGDRIWPPNQLAHPPSNSSI